MTALVQQMNDDVEKALTNVSMKVQTTYGIIIEADKLKILADPVDKAKKIETNF